MGDTCILVCMLKIDVNNVGTFNQALTISLLQWDLVCNRAWLVGTVAAVFMAGRITGNFIFGFFADR